MDADEAQGIRGGELAQDADELAEGAVPGEGGLADEG
jgi:hypothetical protein